MHNRDLIFRALNPENVILDARGYCKLIDFQQVAGLVERPNKGRSEFTGEPLSPRVHQIITRVYRTSRAGASPASFYQGIEHRRASLQGGYPGCGMRLRGKGSSSSS